MTARTITIAGGGLAGLSLGRALAQRGVTVVLHEAGTYPRHKVCGEFISGLKPATSEALNLSPILETAEELISVRWLLRDNPLRTWRLPSSALGLSRHHLDARLADDFVRAGGELRLASRYRHTPHTSPEGHVQATGRLPAAPKSRPRWLGLKAHLLPPFTLEADLEVHLGKHAYVGLSRIEGGRVNLCGLFQRRPTRHGPIPLLEQYLEQAGLSRLRSRLATATIDDASRCAVAGLDFVRDTAAGGPLRLGDSRGMIPPFTGHGMAMALESAALAINPLLDYAQGRSTWERVCLQIQHHHHQRLERRLRHARRLHPMLYRPLCQPVIGHLARFRVLPLNLLYRLTHG